MKLGVIQSAFDGFLGDDLDEIPAGVVKHGNDGLPKVGWSLCEYHASCDVVNESLVFSVNVIDGELGARYAVFGQSVPEWLDRRVAGGFEE
jgi:hypothetical protein